MTLVTLDDVYYRGMATSPAPTSTAPPAAGGCAGPRGDERERAILETAERLLEERPLHEISVDDLARGAGISRPTFYFYFPSKEAVLLTLLDRMVEEARGRIGEALERFAEDPPRWLRPGITAIYETFRSHRAVTLAGADALATSAEVRELWARVMEGFVQETTAAIEAERARGAAPDGCPRPRPRDRAQPDERARAARDLRRTRARGRRGARPRRARRRVARRDLRRRSAVRLIRRRHRGPAGSARTARWAASVGHPAAGGGGGPPIFVAA